MSYYTKFKIYTTAEVIKALIESSEAENLVDANGYPTGSGKWYEYNEDTILVSKQFPTTLIII